MDETPDRPPVPGDDPDPPTTPLPPTGGGDDDLPPLSPLDDTDPGLDPGPDLFTDDGDAPPRRRLTPVRLAAVAVVLLVVGGVAFVGLAGDDDSGDEPSGVASIDGSEGETAEGDDPDGGGGGGRVDDSEFQDAMLDFAECMREHGIDMPDPEFDEGGGGGVMIGGGPDGEDGGGPSQEEFEAADEACQPIMDEVRPDIQLTPEEQAEMQDQQVALAQCMREKGWNMPDPQVNEDGSVMIAVEPGDETNGRAPTPENREDNEADMEACHEELGIEDGGPARAAEEDS